MIPMKIEKNSRQMPSNPVITKEKNYCDLLYAWLQCNSEKAELKGEERCIEKEKIKWVSIERDFTRTLADGTVEKVMGRKTIAKYFKHLEDKGLIELRGNYYYLTVLEQNEAKLIEYNTLSKLMNVLQKNSLSIYIYLFTRYYKEQGPFTVTIKSIKDFIGIATSTTSNNIIVDDTLDILKRLGLLDYQLLISKTDERTYLEIQWVKNKLPGL